MRGTGTVGRCVDGYPLMHYAMWVGHNEVRDKERKPGGRRRIPGTTSCQRRYLPCMFVIL